MVDNRIADGSLIRNDVLKGLLGAIVVAGIVFLCVFGVLTFANTSTTVNYLADTAVQHGQTLKHIDHVASVDKAELAQLKKATITVDQILEEAGLISTEIKNELASICGATHASC